MEENISLKFKLKFNVELVVFFQVNIGLVTEKESNISLKKPNTPNSMIQCFVYFMVLIANKTHFHYPDTADNLV